MLPTTDSISALGDVLGRLRARGVTWDTVKWPADGFGCNCSGHTADGFKVYAEAQRAGEGGEVKVFVTDNQSGQVAFAFSANGGIDIARRMQYTPNEQFFQTALLQIEAYVEEAGRELISRNQAKRDSARTRFFS